MAAQILSIYKSPYSTFHSEERLLFFKKRKRVLCWSIYILLVYACHSSVHCQQLFSWIRTVDHVLYRLRVPGVLQRFGICYWVVATVGFLLSRLRAEERRIRWSTDLLDLLPHWLVILTLLAIHQVHKRIINMYRRKGTWLVDV